MPNINDRLVSAYLHVRRNLLEMGFDEEAQWQEKLDFESIGETDFIMEAAWVILSSGMRESVIRSKWQKFSQAFFFWESCTSIADNSEQCRDAALEIFSHFGKVNAIIYLSECISSMGYPKFKVKLDNGGVEVLQEFPYLGPATSYHLAKNIGLPFAKPDRHLTRIANGNGFLSVHDMCEAISIRTGDKIPVVDLVLWRFATLKKNYLDFLVCTDTQAQS